MAFVFVFDELYNRTFFFWHQNSQVLLVLILDFSIQSAVNSFRLLSEEIFLFARQCPLLLLSLHHLTTSWIWKFFSLIFFLLTTHSAFESGFPEMRRGLLPLYYYYLCTTKEHMKERSVHILFLLAPSLNQNATSSRLICQNNWKVCRIYTYIAESTVTSERSL